MKPKLIIVGAAGRMGRRITTLAIESGKFEIFGAIEGKTHPILGRDIGFWAGTGEAGIEISCEFPAGGDVVIDFSLPSAFDDVLGYCIDNNCALVCGTTGLSDQQLERVRNSAEKIPVIQTTNMSIGMNLLFEIVGDIAEKLGSSYDTEIIEAHHRFKKDAPSGSALTLAENIAKATGKKYPDCLDTGRKGKEATRKDGSIGVQAIRMGDVIGDHSVMFGSLGETVTVSHHAGSRDTFAGGAIRAAAWVVGKKPGFYSMAHVLGLK